VFGGNGAVFLVAAATTLGLCGCNFHRSEGIGVFGPVAPAPALTVRLNIKDRAWDPRRPDRSIGWCGETCIQMAMGYYGKEMEQAAINRAAGGGAAVDEITTENMDAALDSLGIRCERWKDTNPDVQVFIAWIKLALREGHPVICGVKTYPDEHRDWACDHFVLAVGYGDAGLLLNTQHEFDGQTLVSFDDLMAMDKGKDAYSFQSPYRRYFARAILGLRPAVRVGQGK
jgi:hypothetical protein